MNVFAYKKCLEIPERLSNIVGAAWVEHIPFAFWLIEAMGPGTVVELGVWAGDSYLAWCQGAHGLGTRIWGVDHWQGDFQTGEYGEEIYQTLKAYHDPKYAGFSTLIRSSFVEALTGFEDGSIDLLHIDGLHTYEAVKGDFEAWLPKMSARGVVLFHDTEVRERQFGVWKLWEELAARYPHFSFLHGYGLGVLLVGSAVAEPVQELAALAGGEVEEVREIFRTLGRHIRAMEGPAVAKAEAEREASVALEAQKHKALEEQEAMRVAHAVEMARVRKEDRRQADGELQAMSDGYEARLAAARDEMRVLMGAREQEVRRHGEQQSTNLAEIAALRKYVEELEGAIAAMRASKSFKLGQAITSPARLMRRALKG